MSAQTTNLFLLEDLEDSTRTGKLADSDLNALNAVADWIQTFVATPNKDLGRAGPVCPFVPGACERKTLWLAPEQIADRSCQMLSSLLTVTRACSCALNLLRAMTRTTKRSWLFSPICRGIVQKITWTTPEYRISKSHLMRKME